MEGALRAGRLCLSSVGELAKVLTPANQAEVLPRFFGLSFQEAPLALGEAVVGRRGNARLRSSLHEVTVAACCDHG